MFHAEQCDSDLNSSIWKPWPLFLVFRTTINTEQASRSVDTLNNPAITSPIFWSVAGILEHCFGFRVFLPKVVRCLFGSLTPRDNEINNSP